MGPQEEAQVRFCPSCSGGTKQGVEKGEAERTANGLLDPPLHADR